MPHEPHPDPSALYAVATDLDRQAERLRLRAASVAADPFRVRWSSLGARAWAEGVTRITDALLRAAAQLEQVAGSIRGRAVALERPGTRAGR